MADRVRSSADGIIHETYKDDDGWEFTICGINVMMYHTVMWTVYGHEKTSCLLCLAEAHE